jgi:hypothetical protein
LRLPFVTVIPVEDSFQPLARNDKRKCWYALAYMVLHMVHITPTFGPLLQNANQNRHPCKIIMDGGLDLVDQSNVRDSFLGLNQQVAIRLNSRQHHHPYTIMPGWFQ